MLKDGHAQWEERLVHYLYVQDLLLDSRVLEIGAGGGGGADFLAGYARRVTLLDPVAEKLARYRQSQEHANLECVVGEPDHLQFDDHCFDVVLVPELQRWFTRGGLLSEIRRVLAPKGIVLFSVKSSDRAGAPPSGMGFADLEEYLSQSFEHVRIMGTIPFHGVTVADFDPEGELEPQLDCSLVTEDEEPESYLAICGRHPIVSPGYSVVQVPGASEVLGVPAGLSRLLASMAEAEGVPEAGQLALVTQLLDREVKRVAALEQRLDQARGQQEEAARRHIEERGKFEVERVRADGLDRQLTDCQRGTEELRQRAEGAERRCDSLMIRIEQGSAELSTLHHRMAELQGLRQADQWHIDELVGKLRKLEKGEVGSAGDPRELERARARIVKLERELEQVRYAGEPEEALRQRVQEAEARSVAAQQEAAAAEQRARKADSRAGKAEQRVRELERQSEEQLQEKGELEKELMRSESRVTENARRATNAESKIVQMEVRLKRAESEAATLSKWAEELREELKRAQGKSSAVPPTPEPEVAALRNELREARARVSALEERCDVLMREVEETRAELSDREARLEEALGSADRGMFDELVKLRRANIEVTALREQLKRSERELARAEDQLRDSEQAEAELGRTRRELMELKHRVTDIDAASEELEQLRMQAVHRADAEREIERLRQELEEARIELTRCHEEARAGSALPDEAGWTGWGEEEEEGDEPESYVGPEMPDEPLSEDEEEGEWSMSERVRVQERQIEALLEGAALHRAEMERSLAQIAEMDALTQELQGEQRALEQRLADCEKRRGADQQVVAQLKEENTRLARDLARVQGELRRCHEEQSRVEAAEAQPRVATATDPALRDDLDREVRMRQKLQEDLEQRLAELDELRRELRSKDQAMDRLRSEDTEHRAELRELRRQARDLEREAQACREQLGQREAEISRLTRDLEAEATRPLDSAAGELSRRLAAEEQARVAAEGERSRCQGQLERLQRQLAAAEEQIACLEQDLSRRSAAALDQAEDPGDEGGAPPAAT